MHNSGDSVDDFVDNKVSRDVEARMDGDAGEYERIKDGFRLEYNGLILYEYRKA